MTRLRFSGRYLVSASCGSYMWLSASNTGKESSRDGMAISLKSLDSLRVVMTLPLLRNKVYGRRLSDAAIWRRSVDDREVDGRRRGEFVVAVAVYVDLHDQRPP